MADQIIVHGRIMERHPELTPGDIAHAWTSNIASATRQNDGQLVVVGFDAKGRLLEMVAVQTADGEYLVFHAMTPPSEKTLRETHLID